MTLSIHFPSQRDLYNKLVFLIALKLYLYPETA